MSGTAAIDRRCSNVLQLCGHTLKLSLKTPDWQIQTEREIELCTSNTVPLCSIDEKIDIEGNLDELDGENLFLRFIQYSFAEPVKTVFNC